MDKCHIQFRLANTVVEATLKTIKADYNEVHSRLNEKEQFAIEEQIKLLERIKDLFKDITHSEKCEL